MMRTARILALGALASALLVTGCSGANERPGGASSTTAVERYPAVKLGGPAEVQQYLSTRGVTCNGLQVQVQAPAPSGPTGGGTVPGPTGGGNGVVGSATCATEGGRIAITVYSSAADVPATPRPDCSGESPPAGVEGQRVSLRARGENFTVAGGPADKAAGTGQVKDLWAAQSALTERVGTQSGLLVETTTVRCR